MIRKTILTKHGVTQYVDMFFCFGFLQKFDVCMIGKNYCIVYLYTKTSQIDCFRLVHEILRWIGSSDFKLHIKHIVKKFIPGSNVLNTRKKNICVFNYTVMTKFCMQNIKSSVSMRKIFSRVIFVYFINMWYYFCEKVLNEGTSLISCGRVFHSPITVGTREVLYNCKRHFGKE